MFVCLFFLGGEGWRGGGVVICFNLFGLVTITSWVKCFFFVFFLTPLRVTAFRKNSSTAKEATSPANGKLFWINLREIFFYLIRLTANLFGPIRSSNLCTEAHSPQNVRNKCINNNNNNNNKDNYYYGNDNDDNNKIFIQYSYKRTMYSASLKRN